jgi:hypothetical protein
MVSVASANSTEAEVLDELGHAPDRRVAPRSKVLRGGRTYWPNGDSTECTVYNFSETGAKLELVGHAPNSFDLAVDGDQLRRSCFVVWRKANFVGVRFQNSSRLLSSIGSAARSTSDFAKYVEVCQTLAQRVAPSDSELLLEMAEAWKIAVRRLRKKERNVSI